MEWVAIFFSSAWKWKMKVKSLSRVRLLATPWTAAYQVLLSMGFSRQEYLVSHKYWYTRLSTSIFWYKTIITISVVFWREHAENMHQVLKSSLKGAHITSVQICLSKISPMTWSEAKQGKQVLPSCTARNIRIKYLWRAQIPTQICLYGRQCLTEYINNTIWIYAENIISERSASLIDF